MATTLKKLPIGIQTFREIIEEGYCLHRQDRPCLGHSSMCQKM